MKENMIKVTNKLEETKLLKVVTIASFAFIGAFVMMNVFSPEMYAAAPKLADPITTMKSGNDYMYNFAKSTKGVLTWGSVIGGVICLAMMAFGEHITQGARNNGKTGLFWILIVLVLAQLLPS